MKTYGHLRREHSIAQAQRVTLRAGRDKAGRRDRISCQRIAVRCSIEKKTVAAQAPEPGGGISDGAREDRT